MKPSHAVPTAIAVLALGAATALVGSAPASAAADPTATIGEVSCVAEDGTVTVGLLAGDSAPATFEVLVDGSQIGDDVVLDAAASTEVTADALEDGDHYVEVLAGADVDSLDTIASETRTVTCDPAPVGPYTNVKGDVFEGCDFTAYVDASNTVVGGNTEDLQPVTFEVAFTPTDDPAVTDDGGDPGPDPAPDPAPRLSTVGVEQVLDTFTLDAGTQTYSRDFDTSQIGGTGDLTLRTGDTVVATAHIGFCEVLPVEATAGGGPAVPDTGF